MEKLIILSIVLVSFTVPIWMSTAPNARRALRRTQWIILGFIVLWTYMCLRWYPEIVQVK